MGFHRCMWIVVCMCKRGAVKSNLSYIMVSFILIGNIIRVEALFAFVLLYKCFNISLYYDDNMKRFSEPHCKYEPSVERGRKAFFSVFKCDYFLSVIFIFVLELARLLWTVYKREGSSPRGPRVPSIPTTNVLLGPEGGTRVGSGKGGRTWFYCFSFSPSFTFLKNTIYICSLFYFARCKREVASQPLSVTTLKDEGKGNLRGRQRDEKESVVK